MTITFAGVSVTQLPDHLIKSEYKRFHIIVNRFLADIYREIRIPEKLTFDKNHCKFFYDKGLWLQRRHFQLQQQMRSRHLSRGCGDFRNPWQKHKKGYNDWIPDAYAEKLTKEKIISMILQEPQGMFYYGEEITSNDYFNIILNNPINSLQNGKNQKALRTDSGEEHQGADLRTARNQENNLRIHSA